MKVIFVRDVARVGHKHEIKDVPDGHARNYLIPRKFAVPATPQNLKWQSAQRAHKEAEVAGRAESFQKFLAETARAPIAIKVTANEHGHLFKGLRAADIARALSDTAGFTIDAGAVELDQPIKEIGEYTIAITTGSQQGKVVITVMGK